MTRYVLANPSITNSKGMAAAKKAAKACGVTVIRALPGTLLIEGEPVQLKALEAALPDWKLTPETKTTRVPERTPLERTKARATRR